MLQEGFSNTFWPSLICYNYWFEDIDSVIVGIIIFILLTIICNQFLDIILVIFGSDLTVSCSAKKLMTLLVK
jgi:hypothetical protein